MRVIGLISGTSHDGMDDLGPANALVDAAVVRMSGGAERYDREGRRAATGRVDEELLADLLAEPYHA